MSIVNKFLPPIKEFTNERNVRLSIRLILQGCTNRPFFHIVVAEWYKTKRDEPIDQIGNYDPLPNKFNEKVVSIDFDKLHYWLQKGAYPTEPVLKLLGLCGYFPVHPMSFRDAWTNRMKINTRLNNLRKEVEQLKAGDSSTSTEYSSQEETSADSSKT